MPEQKLRRARAALGQCGDALALAIDAIAVDVGVRPQSGREADGRGRQPFAPPQPGDALRPLRPLHQRGDQFAATGHARAQDLRSEPGGHARELSVMDLRVGDQRARQTRRRLVEPLARQAEQRLGAGQRARSPRAARCGARPDRDASRQAAPASDIDARQQLSAHRHRHFGRRGRRRARWSAAKSISVTSVSWPTAEISGIMLSAAARTTISSLNDHKSSSEPPPRATISRSGRGIDPSPAAR